MKRLFLAAVLALVAPAWAQDGDWQRLGSVSDIDGLRYLFDAAAFEGMCKGLTMSADAVEFLKDYTRHLSADQRAAAAMLSEKDKAAWTASGVAICRLAIARFGKDGSTVQGLLARSTDGVVPGATGGPPTPAVAADAGAYSQSSPYNGSPLSPRAQVQTEAISEDKGREALRGELDAAKKIATGEWDQKTWPRIVWEQIGSGIAAASWKMESNQEAARRLQTSMKTVFDGKPNFYWAHLINAYLILAAQADAGKIDSDTLFSRLTAYADKISAEQTEVMDRQMEMEDDLLDDMEMRFGHW
jgi:hypothetical protein